MGFNKIEKVFKHFNVFDCPQGAEVTEDTDFFYENGLFSVRILYDQPVTCPVINYWKELLNLIRMVRRTA